MVQSIDNVGNQVYFTYTADGLPQTATTTYADNSPTTTVVTTYDPVTREKFSVTDPNTGTSFSYWDGFGRLGHTEDAMGVEHHFTYDVLGRGLTRTTPESHTVWTYDEVTATSNGLGKAHIVTHTTTNVTPPPTTVEEATYDTLGRVTMTRETLANQPAFNGDYLSYVTYDALGRAETATDAGGFTTRNQYNAYGFKSALLRASDLSILWQGVSYDAEGKLKEERHGNGVATGFDYHPQRSTLASSTSYRMSNNASLQKLELDINNLGNVEQRKSTTYDSSGTASVKIENFTFDALNRLETTQVDGQALQST